MAENKDIRITWLNFLKALTRSIVQSGLYKQDHPQVKEAISQASRVLEEIFSDSGAPDFTMAFHNDKLIINRVPLLAADKLPNSLKNIFTRFNIHSISMLRGISEEDIRHFCVMQNLKASPVEYLKQNNIDKILLNKEIYSTVAESAKPQSAEQAQAASASRSSERGSPSEADGQAAQPPAEKIDEKIAAQGLESAVATIVSKATENTDEQQKVLGIIMRKFSEEVENKINGALTEIRKEKKRVENDIARTESVISNMAEGVVVVDKQGKILMMNPQAEAISGKKLAEVSGKQVFDMTQLEQQVVALAKEIKPETEKDISKDVVTKGDASLDNAIKKSTAIIQNEDGKIVGAVSIPTDVAKLKEVQQLKEDFIMNMTHELRSPLTSIKAALEMLSKEEKIGTQSKGVLNIAVKNSEKLNSIITDILDFSKLQSGRFVIHPEAISPLETAREAVESMKSWANSKNLNLFLRNEPELPDIYADKRRTVQILINLISNAIKFTPERGSIEVSVDRGKEALSNLAFFSVKDTGCGVKKEDQGKIFEKFVQVAAGEKVGGTGLGLAITKAMIVMQGGGITVDSDIGKGAVFRVSLPLYRGQTQSPPPEQIAESKEESKPWWRKLLGI
ncbi:MAG: PAS domain S-box protein [Elusimicrobia bacterium]|nr:PAS domain S-box protein [Elusimicrobiota bacterium]